MPFTLESLASLATIAGLVISVLALLKSRAWLVLCSLLFACIAGGAGLYARRERLAVTAASTVIEGRSIDSLNLANLKRRVNRTFVIHEACHTVEIVGEDMKITWRYSGYNCRPARAFGMEFSIDSEAGTPFAELDCEAYDLRRDPEMKRKIRPLLIGTEGISKKISVPFLEPIQAHQPFGVLLSCTLPRCVRAGTGYYTSTLSFAQDLVPRCEVRITFIGSMPNWVRVYECMPRQSPGLVKSLSASTQDAHRSEYVDVVENTPGQSARVYLFHRDSV